MNTHRIYICILNIYNICSTALAYVVTTTESDVQPAPFEFEENDKMIKHSNMIS